MNKDKIKDYWKKSDHDWFVARYHGNFFEKVFFLLKGKLITGKIDFRGRTILDCGCGTGVYTFDLHRKSAFVVGLDISEWALQRAKKIGTGPEFIAGDAERLPFQDNSFDIVVHTAVFQYYKDPNLMISEINRVLKPGGITLIEVPYKYGLFRFKQIIKQFTSKKDFLREPVNRSYTVKEIKHYFSSFRTIEIKKYFSFLIFGIFQKHEAGNIQRR